LLRRRGATVQPQTVLELLDALDSAEAVIETARRCADWDSRLLPNGLYRVLQTRVAAYDTRCRLCGAKHDV
jgi:hypothetical protein